MSKRNLKMSQLVGLVVLSGIPNPPRPDIDESIGDVIAAGPITKQPHTLPFRVVLRATARGEFAVHDQFFPDINDLEKSHFAQGDYFTVGELGLATKRFAERLTRYASHIDSIYRDLQPIGE